LLFILFRRLHAGVVITLETSTCITEVICYDNNDNNKIVPIDNKENETCRKPFYDCMRQGDKEMLLKIDDLKNGNYSATVKCGQEYKKSFKFEVNSKFSLFFYNIFVKERE